MKVIAPENREHVRRASLLLRLARALNLGRTAQSTSTCSNT